MSSILVLAARDGGGDLVIGAIMAISIVALALVLLVRETTASYDLNIRNGLPHCPRCNRQVSYRRDICRACGYRFKTYPSGRAVQAQQGTGELVARRAARRAAREAYYRERGVEPGPWAWFHALPEWRKAVLLGMLIAAPIVGLIVILMR